VNKAPKEEGAAQIERLEDNYTVDAAYLKQ
jgi:hypothetical protein